MRNGRGVCVSVTSSHCQPMVSTKLASNLLSQKRISSDDLNRCAERNSSSLCLQQGGKPPKWPSKIWGKNLPTAESPRSSNFTRWSLRENNVTKGDKSELHLGIPNIIIGCSHSSTAWKKHPTMKLFIFKWCFPQLFSLHPPFPAHKKTCPQ